MKHLSPEQLSARLDGGLQGSAQEGAERHLASCAECRGALAALAAQDLELRPALHHDPGEEYFETFAARVEDRIRAAGLRGAQARLGPGGAFGWLSSPRRLAWVGAVATVVLGAAVVLVTSRLERAPLSPELQDRVMQSAPAPESTAPATGNAGSEPSRPAQEPAPTAARNEVARRADETKLQARGGVVGEPQPLAKSDRDARARAGASASRVIEVRRNAAGEDVPVRQTQEFAAPPAETRAQEGATGRIVKPQAASPATPSAGFAQASPRAVADSKDLAFMREEAEVGATRLCGRVLDPTGRPVAGAVVALADLGRTATTDESGRFCIGTPAGTHELTAIAVGFTENRMQVRAEGPTTDATLTLQPVSVLGPAWEGAASKGADGQDAFGNLSSGARILARTAQQLSSRATSVKQLEAAARAWDRVVQVTPPGEARNEALFRLAEVRVRAWQKAPNATRASAARTALAAYLATAPQGSQREQAERWREQVAR